MDSSAGRALGSRYELLWRIGVGAMGEVWCGRDRVVDRLVAAKLLQKSFAHNPDVVTRFIQERSILVSLLHPNIVDVFDLVVEGDDLAIVMEYFPAGNLSQHITRFGPLPVSIAVSAMCGVLDGLAYAHGRGVLHRDIKPDNVLLVTPDAINADSVRLGDFGIARIAHEQTVHMTGLLGTPAYMAPEIFEHGTFSAASDVYAAGIMLYQLLAGRTPFEGGESAAAVALRHIQKLPPPLPVAPQLWHVLEVMLSKDPSLRLTASGTRKALSDIGTTELELLPLPPQPTPDQWADAPMPSPAYPVAILDESVDIGQTVIPRGIVPSPVTALTGKVEAFVIPEDSARSDATMLGTSPQRSSSTLLSSADPVEPPKRHRLRVLIIILAAVVVLALVGGVAWRLGVFGSPKPDPTPVQPGYDIGAQLPSGLRIDFEAQGDSQAQGILVTVVASASSLSGLVGDILTVFPVDDQGKCSVAEAENETSPVLVSEDGLDIPCGYKTRVNIAAGASQSFTVHVSETANLDLSQWLASIRMDTDQALGSISNDAFYLQRITGIAIDIDDVALHGDTPPVPYRVTPVWRIGGSSDESSVLFTQDTLDYQATDLLLGLTGGEGFSQVSVTVCSQALVTGHRVIAQQPSDSCTVAVHVGALSGAQGQFAIIMPPS